jgi:hypothetical protein
VFGIKSENLLQKILSWRTETLLFKLPPYQQKFDGKEERTPSLKSRVTIYGEFEIIVNFRQFF